MRIRLNSPYTAAQIAEITNGKTNAGTIACEYLTTDTREVQEGDLFVALRGERDDGHYHLREALANGASLLLCETESEAPSVCVESCEDALAALACEARTRINPTVIGITGSAGKTTTKNMVAAVLSTCFCTHRTAENHNNRLGLSLTMLSMPADTEMLVLEMGMNHAGEIAALSRMARPDVAIITNIGHAHIGNLESIENIAAAKREIFVGCAPGTLCLFPDKETLIEHALPPEIIPLRIGTECSCDCHYSRLSYGSNTTVADFSCHTVDYPALSLPGTGKHIAACAAFAIALGQTFGVPPTKIRQALGRVQNDKMRQEIIRRHGITIIADCYNASPESMQAACHTLLALAKEHGGRSLALLGDMLELGEKTRQLHEEIGAYYTKQGVKILFTFGAAAESIAIGARRAGMPSACIYTNPDPAAPATSAAQIDGVIQQGDVLLIKASRALAAERVLALLHAQSKAQEDASV